VRASSDAGSHGHAGVIAIVCIWIEFLAVVPSTGESVDEPRQERNREQRTEGVENFRLSKQNGNDFEGRNGE